MENIQEAVNKGVELSLAGGCKIVGDIAGTLMAAEIVHSSDLMSVSYVELFGLGKLQDAAIESLQSIPDAFAVSPHAPYSCGPEVYRASFESGKKVSTHLSESLAEIEFLIDNSGEFVEVLKQLHVWNETIKPWGKHPIDALLDIADNVPFLAAHVNYLEDCHLQMLADSNMTVAYCPRASDYFGHRDHRYVEMIEAGVEVSLGTDSLLCLDTSDRISVIDDIRYLYKRDNTDPLILLKMGTVSGAIGLGLQKNLVTLDSGETAGLLAFESIGKQPILDIVDGTAMPSWIEAKI
jgi:cytosine/adenosine deaminase-related metal-dependent hydrolase